MTAVEGPMPEESSGPVTEFLERWSKGDDGALQV